ncbi:SCP-like extracellular protein [Phytophthora megakarya]|uniref:SCP-like extracellular protein n=1 Tax=Phytophthora megakarya TaxID=4795 RepID=A0A225V9F7_9STRA|nr:SCP-like extracellular protein [Phytophthora megakarya]
MKISTVFTFTVAAVATVNAESYSEPDQAIWIDRHNYFRTTGLPWSASNMRRIGWDADLATKAATTASKCSATTSTGVNAFQSSAKNASDAIDEAVQQWVVETAVSTIKTMAQPGSNGLDVGVGVYNSYSQVVWAKTTSVGCATASCSGGELVVCEYSPAGNDGKSSWYNHGPQASQCPDGTAGQGGLCIEEGNDANNQIAAIPAGELTYQVYPSFVADVQSILINSARDIANGSVPPTTEAKVLTTDSTSSTPTPKENQLNEDSAMKPPSSKTALQARGSHEDSLPTKEETSKTTKSPSESASPVTQDSNPGPGTVKASSDTGSTFQNEVKSPTTHEAKTSEGANTKEKTESLTTETAETAKTGMSTLGLVSMFILGIAAVAGIIMFVHYRVSTQRQHDIVLDGGIRR